MTDVWIDAVTPWRDGADPVVEPKFPSILGELGELPVRSIQSSRLDDARYQDSKSLERYRAPDSIYMIYMKFDPNGRLIVKQGRKHGYEGELAIAERTLLAEIIAQTQGDTNFNKIVWSRPYYITFVMDNSDWEFHWGPDGKDDPLRFLKYKSGSSDIHIDKNYSFSDAKAVTGLGSGDAFRMINYFLNEHGNEVPQGPPEKYCFNLFLRSPFAIAEGSDSHIVLIVDPDGQNQGPRT